MRVTIEHREEATGVINNHKAVFIDCKVEFSEEERAIIKTRDLYGECFTVRTSTPLPTKTEFFSTNIMRVVGRILMIVGVILGIAGTNFGFLFFVGVGLEIYGWVRTRREDKRFESDEQTVTVKQLLANPILPSRHSCTPSRSASSSVRITRRALMSGRSASIWRRLRMESVRVRLWSLWLSDRSDGLSRCQNRTCCGPGSPSSRSRVGLSCWPISRLALSTRYGMDVATTVAIGLRKRICSQMPFRSTCRVGGNPAGHHILIA